MRNLRAARRRPVELPEHSPRRVVLSPKACSELIGLLHGSIADVCILRLQPDSAQANRLLMRGIVRDLEKAIEILESNRTGTHNGHREFSMREQNLN